MAAFQTFHFALAKTRVIKEDAIAMRVMANELETLRSLPFGELAETTATFRSDIAELNQLKDARASVHVTPFPAHPNDLKRIEVTVQWTGDNGRRRDLSTETLIGDKGGAS